VNDSNPIETERASATPPRTTRRMRLRRQRTKDRASAVRALPTLLTLGNLMCGFAAIHYVAKPIEPTTIFGWNTLTVAGTLIFLGMFFDGIDGFAARLTRSASSFGAQLDSLADVVTFGVAPAFMMLRLVSHYYGPSNYTGILGPDADSI
jgi:CDP-diacylglycerol--serine O-phosphatidyltransferase